MDDVPDDESARAGVAWQHAAQSATVVDEGVAGGQLLTGTQPKISLLLWYTQFFNKQLLYKQQGFKNLQIKQSEGFNIWN